MNQSQVLIAFITFFLGAVLSLLLSHVFVIDVQSTKSNDIIRTLVLDVKESEIVGALSIIDQCNDKGVAYIRTIDGSVGYEIKCDENTISVISDNRVRELNLEAREYASKRMTSRFN